MAGLTLAAPAKLNLRLLVGPRRPDGYHEVRTLMVALEGLADRVTVAPADARAVRCPGLDGPANLAWRALDALERAVGLRLDCAVTIDKRIPAGAGLGGGSSDAAATLVAANRLLGLGLGGADLEAVAAQVGSDVPFFVRGGARWAGGRGERLAPEDAPAPGFAALLAMPPEGLSTPAVYAAFDRMAPPPPGDGRCAPEAMPALAAWARNDLWPAALALRPGLGALARALRAGGARAALLCGSGSALAGLVEDRDAAERVRDRLPPGAAAWTAVVTSPRRSASLATGPAPPKGWDGP
ncbi:MAG: 4-diphosphocytidyl-2-C-methyl-D-erythritol kinase [Miltoncostaeaceae bacterium]|nr:4-diphosphocytidyl-2-C-methyl-D-erythritol kinase [Miltoncostaeaceae bacterium]